MSVIDIPPSPVRLAAVAAPGQPEPTPALEQLYRGFEQELLVPLWTQIGDLMPREPRSKASAHLWRWDRLLALADEAGRIVPVGRGGERRAIALANPSLGGRPFATPTLWAAIQYLMPGEDAPEHRHSQHAFRFVVEGEGVWTVVNGDSVRMSRGDFLPQGGWNWHAHHNAASQPMAWIDGLDIPFSYYTESQFFEFGRESLPPAERISPEFSRSERLWAHPGLRPVSQLQDQPTTPLLAYRWVDTDRALAEQLALEAEGVPATLSPGHAAVRFCNPTNGRDVLPTLRCEMHRIRQGASTLARQEVGSAVFQVFEGRGRVTVGERSWDVARGDLFVVPSWMRFEAHCDKNAASLDLFRFSDSPIFESLHAHRTLVQPR
ncbi:cupin domain-containing protein [Xenophilus arseniciresistens]|uniref:Cupin domain-containing protein n=1 Tax=Xenophilus arseniciresistens TaxID=1283306 RepID=A0AAE3NBK2_9BURK|nr:cupin domain-containing protein [Xenophilus arseniciresistens]MDA7416624.1 cupin domain-containing protein [Xenophilus arseniciresistens]